MCISLCAGWVCSSDLQPKLSCSTQFDGKIVVACTNTPCHKKTNAHKNPMETLLAFNIVVCNQSQMELEDEEEILALTRGSDYD